MRERERPKPLILKCSDRSETKTRFMMLNELKDSFLNSEGCAEAGKETDGE